MDPYEGKIYTQEEAEKLPAAIKARLVRYPTTGHYARTKMRAEELKRRQRKKAKDKKKRK